LRILTAPFTNKLLTNPGRSQDFGHSPAIAASLALHYFKDDRKYDRTKKRTILPDGNILSGDYTGSNCDAEKALAVQFLRFSGVRRPHIAAFFFAKSAFAVICKTSGPAERQTPPARQKQKCGLQATPMEKFLCGDQKG